MEKCKLNKMMEKQDDLVTFTFRWFGALGFAFFCDLSVLFAAWVAVWFQLVVSRHQTLGVALSPGTFLISTRWKRFNRQMLLRKQFGNSDLGERGKGNFAKHVSRYNTTTGFTLVLFPMFYFFTNFYATYR